MWVALEHIVHLCACCNAIDAHAASSDTECLCLNSSCTVSKAVEQFCCWEMTTLSCWVTLFLLSKVWLV